MKYNIAVLGTGSWGTAQACHLKRAGHNVTMWGRSKDALQELEKGFNSKYYPGVPLEKGLKTQADLSKAVENQDMVVFAVPSGSVRTTASLIKEHIPNETLVVSTAKGLEKNTLKRMSEVLSEELGRLERLTILSGPSFGREVLEDLPTAVTVASPSLSAAKAVSEAYHYSSFRPYISRDLVGTELGGVIKNVIAVAVGIIDGFGMGCNARAALLTRGMVEIRRLVLAEGGRSSTVSGLSGLGDLLLTTTGDLSRNRQVGLSLGKGQKLEQILKELGQVAEGVYAAASILEMAKKHNIDTPIIEETLMVIQNKHTVPQAVHSLLSRSTKLEN